MSQTVNGSREGHMSTVKLVSRIEEGDWRPSGPPTPPSRAARDLVRACVTSTKTQDLRKQNPVTKLSDAVLSMAGKSSTHIDRIAQLLRSAARGIEAPSIYFGVFEDLFAVLGEDGILSVPLAVVELLVEAQASYNRESQIRGPYLRKWNLGKSITSIKALKAKLKRAYLEHLRE